MRITRADGPVVLAQRGVSAPLSALAIVRTDRGVTVGAGALRVDLVEHLFAAVGGLGVSGGLHIETDADEMPLLDGGSRCFVEAIASLDPPRGRRLRVTRAESFEHQRSIYRFTPGLHAGARVEIDFPAPVGRQDATWDGDAEDFAARIAPARTFGWVHELAALQAAGRAAEVDPASVIVFDASGPLPQCRPPDPDEPARHKLLDLIGDLALHGGPPVGLVEASRPGHTATHAVVAQALACGVLAMEPS
ncbi:UDP-3-O-[3-hydroxymyristoyl] N-acetylglucosamine deacetylase [Minicystis rosea]|nr:UDP-3-O-[3-hydroxymyristoyl] N-acetylglucosamine deacetylase [Minicystis rosea]